jgi:hypothetical protein
MTGSPTWVDLYWLPLGAGGHSVRLNGKVFEAVAARLEKRTMQDLYHSALEVTVPQGSFVIEQAPARPDGPLRGVVAEGPVGRHWAGSLRLFRYEIRRWRNGVIPDVDEAVDSPQLLSDDPAVARRVLELVAEVPTPVWGRDEFHAGEMWNSNSVIAWVLARSGINIDAVHPPPGGRAPGWRAGLVVARRQQRRAPAALVPRWPSQDAHVARAGSGARESRSSRSRADAAPARGLRPSRPDQMPRPR